MLVAKLADRLVVRRAAKVEDKLVVRQVGKVAVLKAATLKLAKAAPKAQMLKLAKVHSLLQAPLKSRTPTLKPPKLSKTYSLFSTLVANVAKVLFYFQHISRLLLNALLFGEGWEGEKGRFYQKPWLPYQVAVRYLLLLRAISC